uniref:Uncharacterized protein n=1 Tax=Panagrellus redivivus TaxID=6233 RepID=A0A7E4ZUG6_PANRE
MKTAVFGHDDGCDESSSATGPILAPPLTFAAPHSSLSVTGTSHQRRSGTSPSVTGSGVSATSSPAMFRAHTRRASRMQNVLVEQQWWGEPCAASVSWHRSCRSIPPQVATRKIGKSTPHLPYFYQTDVT